MAFTNNAYNVQNPNIGTSEEPDGWTGIAYTVRGTLPAGSDISALAMTVEKNNADATVSGSCVTSEGGDDYTLNLSGTDKMITVTYDDMTRNYYVAATVTDSGKINVTIHDRCFQRVDVAYPDCRCPRSIVRWATASGDNTGLCPSWRSTAARPSMTRWSLPAATAGITIGAQQQQLRRLRQCDRRHRLPAARAGWMYSVNGAVPMVGAGQLCAD